MMQELSDPYMKYSCPQQALEYSVFCVAAETNFNTDVSDSKGNESLNIAELSLKRQMNWERRPDVCTNHVIILIVIKYQLTTFSTLFRPTTSTMDHYQVESTLTQWVILQGRCLWWATFVRTLFMCLRCPRVLQGSTVIQSIPRQNLVCSFHYAVAKLLLYSKCTVSASGESNLDSRNCDRVA